MREAIFAFTCFLFVMALVAAWATHVVYCILNGLWLMLLAGAILAPVGIVHGVMVWFGAGMPA